MQYIREVFLLIFISYGIGLTSPVGSLYAQNASHALLQSGPMLGYAQMREVALWVQTKQPARVKFVYYETTQASVRYETQEVLTSRENAYVAHCYATEVEPGRRYTYELYINGKKVSRPYRMEFQTLPLWQWRSDPPTFKIATGSCSYINEPQYDRPGKPYGSNYQIFSAIHACRPDAMVWLGDNIYLREPDWTSRTGILKRYTHTRSIPELQPLLASTHHYAIWDDHDYGPNDADRSFWAKHWTYEAFRLFWANPSYGIEGKPSCITHAEWGDVELFMLDNRTFRSPNSRKTGERRMLGDEQIQWLIDALSSSRATFKIIAVGGQVLNPLAIYENYATFPEERQKLLDLIEKENIKGVVFLTGDRHHTELNKLERAGTYPLYEFTISPLTAGTSPRAAEEANPLRVPGTFVGEHNFALLEFSGPLKDRVLKCTVYNADGKELWSYSIKASELR
ncbi:MAG: alkaline phosphatase family protein [Candidatus Kapabacteria bacterium]|nr:alkaline phosphatase family protein [Candidatus Kapabacteria bacterium]